MDCYSCELWEQGEDGVCIHYINRDCPYSYNDEKEEHSE